MEQETGRHNLLWPDRCPHPCNYLFENWNRCARLLAVLLALVDRGSRVRSPQLLSFGRNSELDSASALAMPSLQRPPDP